MFAERKDLGVRVAGEKARLADEFITRSQVVAGTNITLDTLPNFDIRISAVGGGGGGVQARQLTVDLWPVNRPAGGLGLPVDIANHYYASVGYVDLTHNWNLFNKDSFHFTWVDLASAPGINAARHSCPRAVGLDANTVRIWAAVLVDYTANYRITMQEFIPGGAA